MNKEELFEYCKQASDEITRLQAKIDKAIEYLKAMQNSDLIFTAICEKELLEILDKGSE